jgi:hypothetical protein
VISDELINAYFERFKFYFLRQYLLIHTIHTNKSSGSSRTFTCVRGSINKKRKRTVDMENLVGKETEVIVGAEKHYSIPYDLRTQCFLS